MKKSSPISKTRGFLVLSAALLTSFSVSTLAQDEVNLDAIRAELKAAKAAAKSGTFDEITPSTASFSVKDDDLEKKRAELLAKENALLNQLQEDGSSPLKTPTPSVKVAPKNEGAILPTKSVTEDDADSFVHTTETIKARTKMPETESVEVAPTRVVSTPKASSSTKSAGEFDAIKTIEASLNTLRRENANLESQLKAAKSRSNSLQKDLEETRDRLMIAETEVERLSGVVKTRNQETLQKMNVESKEPAPQMKKAPAVQPAIVPAAVVRKEQPKVADDVLIGTVVAEKANLRTGPGKDNSPFMTVPRGARLTVETRNGEWYRVITPTGSRAWVAAEVLSFGANNQASPSGAIRIRGYNPALDNDSLRLQNTSLRE